MIADNQRVNRAGHQLIIIGAGVGSLAAAVYARLNGFDVLVLESQDSAGGKARRVCKNGFRFDPGPSIIILPEIYESLFHSAGRDMAAYLNFTKLKNISRVHWSGFDKPLDVPAQFDEVCQTIGELNKSDQKNFRDFINKIDAVQPDLYSSFFEKPIESILDVVKMNFFRLGRILPLTVPFKEWVDKQFQHPVLRAMFYGFPSYSGNTYLKPCPGAVTLPYFMIQQGVYYPLGGVAEIPNAIYKIAVELGVSFQFGAKVNEIELNNNRISSLSCDNGDKYNAEAFISNLDYYKFQSLIHRQVNVKPSLSYFTIQWGLKENIVGLAHHNLLVPKSFEEGFEQIYRQGQFPTHPIVYLNETVGLDPGSAPQGGGNLLAVVTVPSQNGIYDWTGKLEEAKWRTFATMEECGVNIVNEKVVVESIQTPLTFQDRDGNYCGSLYGADENSRGFLGLPYANGDSRIHNLAYCGGSVQPGAGLPMACLSGKFAVNAIMKKLKIKN